MARRDYADEVPDDLIYGLFDRVLSAEAARVLKVNRRLGRHIDEETEDPAEAGYWFSQNEPMLRRYAQNYFGLSQECRAWLEAAQKGAVPQNVLESANDALSAASNERLLDEAKRRGLLDKGDKE